MSVAEAKIKELTDHTYGTWSRQKAWSTPMLVTDAEGIYFYNADGKQFMDFSSQLMCTNLGFKNKAVIEAIIKQAEKLPYVAPGFVTEAAIEAVEALRQVMPENLTKFFFALKKVYNYCLLILFLNISLIYHKNKHKFFIKFYPI